MMKWTVIIVLCFASRAAGDQAANGSNGVNARVTGLTGGGGGQAFIGQVESERPGKAGYDSNSNSASNTRPNSVFFQTTLDSANSHTGDHPTGVANLMIGQSTSFTGRTAADYPTYEGVAPGAFLYASAAGSFDQFDLVESLNRIATTASGNVEAINMSFIVAPLQFPEGPDGSSHFSKFLDWSARQHDVLYIAAWGNSTQEVERAGPDIFNGIVVGASEQPTGENVWRKFSDVNSTTGLFPGTIGTMHIDLLAPGKNIQVLERNDTAQTRQGTSYAAPLTTGAVALLQDFVRTPGHAGNFTNATKHQAMKAVLMNSADKLSGVHGSSRTAIDRQNLDWTQSEAYGYDPIPLDDELGAGLLNVQNAVTQLEPGKFAPGPIPLIGWDYGGYS